MPAGRPTIYGEDILTLTQEYIDSCEDEVVQVVSGQSDKFTAFQQKVNVKLPTIEGLAYHLDIHKDTVFDWEKKYPEFSDLLSVLRNKQVVRLINMGLSGDYNAAIVKLILSKHGYYDKQQTEHSGQVGTTVVLKRANDYQNK